MGVDNKDRAGKLARKGEEPLHTIGAILWSAETRLRCVLGGRRKGVYISYPSELSQAKKLLKDCDMRRCPDYMVIGRTGHKVLTGNVTGHCRLRGIGRHTVNIDFP